MNERNDAERDFLIEQVCASWRPRDLNGAIQGHPSWFDLSEEDRQLAYEATFELRRIEAALQPEGLSTTAQAVMGIIRNQI
jgi:hypothetical protein